MNVLVLHGYGVALGASGRVLVVRERDGGSRKIPVADVDLVLVASSGVSVSSRALRLLAGSGVGVVVVDKHGNPVGVYYSAIYSRTVDTRRGQYLAYYDGRAPRIIYEIVLAKVENQECVLRLLGVDEGSMATIHWVRDQLLQGPPAGVREARREALKLEAAAAREYWSRLASLLPGGLGFRGRDRRAPDPVNAALNYGYGILYGLAWRSLVLAGLDPYAGFLHADRSGKPTLAFDYVELFRAHAVDLPIVGALLEGWRPGLEEGRLPERDRVEAARLVKEGLGQDVGGVSLEEAIKGHALELAGSLRRGSSYRAWRGCTG